MKSWIRRLMDRTTLVSRKTYYSQLGEDAVLRSYFKETKGKSSRWRALFNVESLNPGFYVDVGAYSPKRISNSYWFYQQGWQGVTVEPNPVAAKDFRAVRPRDIHLNIGVSRRRGKAYYYSSGYSVTNFISYQNEPKAGYEVQEIEVWTLAEVFESYDHADSVDFLSVDCEGHDLVVLQSNNWSLYRPSVVLVEDHNSGLDELKESPIVGFMRQNGYELFSWTMATVMFQNSLRKKDSSKA